jgi:hypothetical protein
MKAMKEKMNIMSAEVAELISSCQVSVDVSRYPQIMGRRQGLTAPPIRRSEPKPKHDTCPVKGYKPDVANNTGDPGDTFSKPVLRGKSHLTRLLVLQHDGHSFHVPWLETLSDMMQHSSHASATRLQLRSHDQALFISVQLLSHQERVVDIAQNGLDVRNNDGPDVAIVERYANKGPREERQLGQDEGWCGPSCVDNLVKSSIKNS